MSPRNNSLKEVPPSRARCCIYLRKSQSDDPTETVEETLNRHENRLRKLAKQNGHHIAHVYREVVSGETIAARKEIKKLLNSAGDWDYVYCVREDRLARGDSVDQGLVARAFMASNTKIATPNKVFDLSNRSDQQFFEVSLFLARMEYRFITERMKDGLQDSLDEGQYMGRFTPYGYDKWTNERGQKTLVPNDKAPIVAMMFDWSARENKSYYWIARELTRMGVKAPRGGDEWAASSVGEILRNEIYVGMIRWGRRKTQNAYSSDGYDQGKEVKLNADYDLYPGLHEPMIDRATFELSLRNAKQRTPIHHGNALHSPLAGLLVCKKCGRAMGLIHDRRRDDYRYQHKNLSPRFCERTKGGKVDVVMAALKDHLMTFLGEMKMLVTDDGPAREADRIEESIAVLRKEIASIDRAQDILLATLESGDMSPDLFGKRNAIHEERRVKIESAIAELEQSIPDQAAIEDRIVAVSECLAIIDDWRECAVEVNQFLKTFISKIEITNDSDHGRYDKMTLEITFVSHACSHTK